MSSFDDLCTESLKGGRTMEPELMIRIGLDGIRSVELQTDESDAEARLLELWASLRPIIEGFFVGARS